jgi:hypothetical protein
MARPDWTITRSRSTINRVERDCVKITTSALVIDAVELDMADQWDFMELAGPQLDNEAWVNTALLAASVIAIDGMPVPSGPKSREGIRQVLRKLGPVGLDALQAAFAEPADDRAERRRVDEEATAAGN